MHIQLLFGMFCIVAFCLNPEIDLTGDVGNEEKQGHMITETLQSDRLDSLIKMLLGFIVIGNNVMVPIGAKIFSNLSHLTRDLR